MKHLDIGCGDAPKNPYDADELYGVDAHPGVLKLGANFRCVNVVFDGIPFPDSHFDCVSAFDVLEHIPRQIFDSHSRDMKHPFIDLMNEVYRVLKPGGMFYALTPAYPAPEAFQDPTHVNFITEDTHVYFCGQDAFAGRYGFKGQFEKIEVAWLHLKYAQKAKRNMRVKMKNWRKRYFKGGLTHLVWQLRATKGPDHRSR